MASKFSIQLHPDAQVDINGLLRTHYLEATRILATIQQCKADRSLFDKLSSVQYASDEDRIDIHRWERLHKLGVEVWRFKVLDLERDGKRYRIFYAYSDKLTVWILAIQPRDKVDYDDPDHSFAHRIERAVASLRAAAERAKRVPRRKSSGYVLSVSGTKH